MERFQLRNQARSTNNPQAYLAAGGVLRNGQIPTGELETKPFSSELPSLPAPISVAGLTEKVAPIVPPPPAPDTTNYDAILAGGTVPKTTAESSTTQSYLEKFLASSTPPPSTETAYTSAEQQAGMQAKQEEVLRQQQRTREAQNKLNVITGQLESINLQSKATQERLLQEATGRGITTGGLQPMQASELRKSSLASLALQPQLYAAQAEVAAVQGDLAGSQAALQTAQDRLTTLFKLKSDDADRTYTYWKDLRSKVLDFATEEQKTKLAAQQKEDDRKYQEERDNRKRAQDVADAAMNNGQAALSSRIAQLDEKSGTFTEDLAKLQGQILIKPKGEGGTFTQTQTNKGASNSGVSLKTFNSLPADTQNVLINNSEFASIFRSDLLSYQNGELDRETFLSDINNTDALSQEAKDGLISIIDKTIPIQKEKGQSFLGQIWAGIKSLF